MYLQGRVLSATPVISSYVFPFAVTSIESESMSSTLKFNSAVFVVLVGLFVFATLNLNRLRVPPFGLDPCDAVMHFAVFTMLLALVGSLRALLPYRGVTVYRRGAMPSLEYWHSRAIVFSANKA